MNRRASGSTALKRLMTEYKELTTNAPDGITAGPVNEDDFFTWEALIAGPDDTPYEGGMFPATITFPRDYPLSPPTMKFTCPIFHPNVYSNGTVCISILHPPGDDPNHYEHASERWSPVQSVEKILLSVVSMLAEPNDESPANVEASKMYRSDRQRFESIVRANTLDSIGLSPEEAAAAAAASLGEEFEK
ncbi:Ubiquitin-conjugating enzyme E2 7 [Thoreauomyces humboldtii]|nr:Ubiquitin-conjugating enzyme E2 7 [Thoreauomyces humboldtii]